MFSLKHLLATDRRRLERDIAISIHLFAYIGNMETVEELLRSPTRTKEWES